MKPRTVTYTIPKARKPRPLDWNWFYCHTMELKSCPIYVVGYALNLNEAKRLRNWLDKAIRYLEARKSK